MIRFEDLVLTCLDYFSPSFIKLEKKKKSLFDYVCLWQLKFVSLFDLKNKMDKNIIVHEKNEVLRNKQAYKRKQ